MTKRSPKILIIRLSSIGDILLTTPFIQQVRNKFSNAEITYIVKKEFTDLLKHNPNIDEIIAFDASLGIAGLLDLAGELKQDGFDIIFDLHNNLRSNRITAVFKRSKVTRIKKYKFKRWLLVNLKIDLYRHVKTAPEKYRNVGSRYGIGDNNEKLQIFFDDETRQKTEQLLSLNELIQGRYICLAPGAAHFTKRWPVEYMDTLIQKILNKQDIKIVIVGGPGENDLLTAYEGNKNVVNFCGKTSLLQSAGILKYSKGIITNDSGLMHMAAAVDIPIIALFGSTAEQLGFFPYRANATILQVDLWCRPCTHIGREKCPLGHFNCMRLIAVKDVFTEMEKKFGA